MTQASDSKAGKAAPMDRLWAENDDSRAAGDPALVVDVDGFEGPLDLLLHLARNQKVDLARISVLALAEQYLVFIETARALRLELAADYLVMAAWLAFLKSKLLIPKQPGEEGESGEELAAVLQFRLKRLEAMRDAAARLVNRNRLGRDVFARGMPELVIVEKRNEWSATLYDLLTAYAVQRQRQAVDSVKIARRGVWSLKDARDILIRMVGALRDWTALDQFLVEYLAAPQDRATAIASRDVFARGMPELVIVEKRNEWSATLYDLLTAYAVQRQRQAIDSVKIARRGVWSLKDARDILTRMVGALRDWTALDQFLVEYLATPEDRATAIASSFAASLELIREGALEARQEAAFAPLYLRGRQQQARKPLEVVS